MWFVSDYKYSHSPAARASVRLLLGLLLTAVLSLWSVSVLRRTSWPSSSLDVCLSSFLSALSARSLHTSWGSSSLRAWISCSVDSCLSIRDSLGGGCCLHQKLWATAPAPSHHAVKEFPSSAWLLEHHICHYVLMIPLMFLLSLQ